jgi:DNA-binding MurR/RpiR family transcriptional regulator
MKNNDMLLLKIRGLLPSLNPALQKIGAYVIENPGEVKTLRIKELARRCGVAEATITRFVKTIGLEGFQDLKISLAELATMRAEPHDFVYDEVSREDDLESIADKIFYINSKALEDTRKVLDLRQMEHAVDAIERAENIDIYGAGGSFVTAENARTRFYRIGKRCIVYNDPNQQAVSASLLGQGDVAIGISNSGRTISTVRALEGARGSGATTICITSFELTPITRHADIVLLTSTQDSQFFQESMVSRLAQITVIDVLYAGLAVRTFERSVTMIERSADALRHAFL